MLGLIGVLSSHSLANRLTLPMVCVWEQGLRILDNACDSALEHAERPLRLWGTIER